MAVDRPTAGRTLLALALGALLAACASTPDAAVTTVATTSGGTTVASVTTESTVPETTVAPTTTVWVTSTIAAATTTIAATTTVVASGPGKPGNKQDDPELAWNGIIDFLAQLSVAPDRSLLPLVVDPECPCYRGYDDVLSELEENGWRYSGDSPTVTTDFLVVEEISPTEVVVAVETRSPADQVLDATGAVVRREPPVRSNLSVLLRRGEDARWRIAQLVDAG